MLESLQTQFLLSALPDLLQTFTDDYLWHEDVQEVLFFRVPPFSPELSPFVVLRHTFLATATPPKCLGGSASNFHGWLPMTWGCARSFIFSRTSIFIRVIPLCSFAHKQQCCKVCESWAPRLQTFTVTIDRSLQLTGINRGPLSPLWQNSSVF